MLILKQLDNLSSLSMSDSRDFKIYDAAARRRDLQNKGIIEWIICSPKSILNTVLVL